MPADPVREFEEYRSELLARLGDGDPLDVLAHTPRGMEERLKGIDEATLSTRPGEGAWSVKEILGHLGDSEWVYGYRMRMMLSHDAPEIAGYDQDVMVAGMAHNGRPLSMLLEELRRLRGLNLDLYLRTKGLAWERYGRHSERGVESVGLSIELLAGHDLRHRDQIERTLAAVGA
ncbi:MAG: DinB family protein [Gemmatimonadota bacterium]|nr:MAG: DinB family protein [Gemmatimonadota bacterium]